MVRGKVKFALWISPETKAEVEQTYKTDNCGSQSEFVERAITFYLGYLHAKKASDYLPEVLSVVLTGTLENFGERIGRMLYKQTIEMNVCNHIFAKESDISSETYQWMRNKSVQEVKSTNGRISFADVIRSERAL